MCMISKVLLCIHRVEDGGLGCGKVQKKKVDVASCKSCVQNRRRQHTWDWTSAEQLGQVCL